MDLSHDGVGAQLANAGLGVLSGSADLVSISPVVLNPYRWYAV
jgi:hypothetical protein